MENVDSGKVFERLLHLAVGNGIVVRFAPLCGHDALLKGRRLVVRQEMPIEDINYNLAHEIAHAFLHYDKGRVIGDVNEMEYEEQADRAAKMLLAVLEGGRLDGKSQGIL